MHRTLKSWIGEPKENFLQQQEALDNFVEEYNNERAHEALGMKTPAEVHTRSPRIYTPQYEDLEYPNADVTQQVTLCGEISFKRKRIYISRALGGYNIGITRQDEDIYLVKFMDYQLGFFDLENRKVLSIENPFAITKV